MNIKDFQKQLQDLINSLKSDIDSGKFLQDDLEITKEEIKSRVTKGFGVKKQGGSKEKFKALSESYKKQRAKLKLGPDAKQNKSNLHLTGQMVESIEVNNNKIEVTGEHNKDKALWAEANGRPFMHITKQELKRLKDRVKEKLLKLLKLL